MFGTNVAFVCSVVISVNVVIEGVGVVEEGVEGLDFLVDDCVCSSSVSFFEWSRHFW